MTTIHEAFDLPEPEALSAQGFVVKLAEADPSGGARARDRIERLVADYVLTPTVEQALPDLVREVLSCRQRGEDRGRFLHGSFGSGKSHLMSFLGLLLEDDATAWRKDHPVVRALAAEARPALAAHPLLVVRIHMLTLRTRSSGFDHAIYEGFNAALRARGKPPCAFVDAGAVLAEARREAALYGEAFWRNLAQAELVDGPESFEEQAAGTPEEQEELARAYLAFKGRDATAAQLETEFATGLARLAGHAAAQGFHGVVFLVDELILWLAEKGGREFAHEINNLNLVVDHGKGKLAVPLYLLVARQRNIRDSFPDDTSEDKIFEHLSHHEERFEETPLEEIELRHVVRSRVLRRRPGQEAAVEAAVADAVQRHEKALPELLRKDQGVDYLRDVFPFHPALIEALIDVSTCLQRERSALRLIYELLCLYYPRLRLGDLMPVGSAFDAIFPPGGIEGGRRLAQLRAVHQAYYGRLLDAIRARHETTTPARCQRLARPQAAVGCAGCPEVACFRSNQLVKTVLLAEVSPRLKQGGLTLQRLVRLNEADVEGDTDRGRVAAAEADLQALNRVVPSLQLTGRGKTATVGYVLQGVNLAELLEQARAEVSTPRRFTAFYGVFLPMLGLRTVPGFRAEDPRKAGKLRVAWRGTDRVAFVRVANVRELTQADFAPPEDADALVLVDYPWDEEGHGVEEDRQRALGARRSLGSRPTVCWLPRHFTPTELGQLTELAALDLLLEKDGDNRFLEGRSQDDRHSALEQARVRRGNTEADVREAILTVYRANGEALSLLAEVDTERPEQDLGKNLLRLAGAVFDRRWPGHPRFTQPVTKRAVAALARWLVEADASGRAVEFDPALEEVLDGLGIPLELVQKGQTRAGVRTDGRFLREVLKQADRDEVEWTGERGLAATLREQWGAQDLVLDLFLDHLARARGYRLIDGATGEAVEPGEVGGTKPRKLLLRRGRLVELAAWSEARELGQTLLGVGGDTTRTLANQDALVGALRAKAVDARRELTHVHERLVGLLGEAAAAAAPRVAALREALKRLAMFERAGGDSFELLGEFRTAWTGRAGDAASEALRQVGAMSQALDGLRTSDKKNLERARTRPEQREAIEPLLGDLQALLAGTEPGRDLAVAAIAAWNHEAERLIGRLLADAGWTGGGGGGGRIGPGGGSGGGGGIGPGGGPGGGSGGGGGIGPGPGPGGGSGGGGVATLADEEVVLDEAVDLSEADGLAGFVASVRAKLQELGRRRGRLRLVFEPEAGDDA